MKEKKKKGFLKPLVKLFIAAIFLVYAVGGILNLRGQITERKAEAAALQAEVAAQRVLNATLEEDIASEDAGSRMERAARDKLGMVKPEEFIIYDLTP